MQPSLCCCDGWKCRKSPLSASELALDMATHGCYPHLGLVRSLVRMYLNMTQVSLTENGSVHKYLENSFCQPVFRIVFWLGLLHQKSVERNLYTGCWSSMLLLDCCAKAVLWPQMSPHIFMKLLQFCTFLQMDDEEVALVRQKLVAVRETWFKHNEEEVMKRWAFEEAVSLKQTSIFVVALRVAYCGGAFNQVCYKDDRVNVCDSTCQHMPL